MEKPNKKINTLETLKILETIQFLQKLSPDLIDILIKFSEETGVSLFEVIKWSRGIVPRFKKGLDNSFKYSYIKIYK